jgi:putative transposase
MLTGRPRRLQHFSYLGLRRYALTFCTDCRRPVFVDTPTVDLVVSHFLRAAAVERFAIIVYCMMPDHAHLLVEGSVEHSDLRRFIKLAKQLSGFSYARRTGNRLWQRYSFERVVRDRESTRGIVRYILENPVRAGLVERIDDYAYLGSSQYAREDLLEFAYR